MTAPDVLMQCAEKCVCVALIMQRRAAVINVDETDGGSLLKRSDLSPQLHTVYDQPP